MKKLILMTLAVALLVVACNPSEEKSEKSVAELVNANSDEWDKAVRAIYDENNKVDSSKLGIFEWETMEYDFGTVVEGEVVEYSYKFKNVGSAPLIIKDAMGSCGCTVPKKPKEPIAPGATSEINVRFNSTGKVGSPEKKVTIIANTLPSETVLVIKGKVDKK